MPRRRPRHETNSSRGRDTPVGVGYASSQNIEPVIHPRLDRRDLAAAAGVVVVAFLVFRVCLGFNEFLDWDDRANFLENTSYRGLGSAQLRWMFTSYHMGHYIPVTWMTLGLDFILAERIYGNGLDARVYHWTNNILHAVNAGLFYVLTVSLLAIIRRETGRRPWGHAAAGAVAALLFAVHPLRVESVAWVTERRDLLSAFFVLLMLIAYARAPDWRHGRGKWLALVTVLFALGALSKIIVVMLAPALLVLDWYPLRRVGWVDGQPLRWRALAVAIVEKAPILIVGAVLGGYATHLSQGQQWLAPLSVHGVGARVAQSFYGLVFYFWKTAVPTGLLPMYEMRLPLNPLEPRFIASAAVVCAVAAALFWMRRRAAGLIAAALCYAIVLLPVLGPMQNGLQIVADRYSYLACMGWMVIIAAGLERLWRSARVPRVATAATGTLCLAAIAACAVLTQRQCLVWRSTATLWEYMVRNDPGSSYAQNSHGWVRYTQGAADEAIERFREAIRIYPSNLQAHRNLFIALYSRRDHAALLEACDAASKVNRRDAMFVSDVQFNRGEALRMLKRHEEAIQAYRQSLDAMPHLPRAWEGLARAQDAMGRREEAIRTLRQALQVTRDPQRCRDLLLRLSPGG